MVKNVLSIIVILALFLNSVNFVFAQEVGGTIESQQSDVSIINNETATDNGSDESSLENPNFDVITPDTAPEVTESESIEEITPADTNTVPAPEEEKEQGLDLLVVEEPVATTTEVLKPTGEKFKKDLNLSTEEQLVAVRQHLLKEGLPQVAIDRLNAFEARQTKGGVQEDGFLKKVWKFITGNSDEAKSQHEAEEFANKEPFKVETFEGKINIVDVSRYEKDFYEAKEQGNLIQKVKNLIENGTFFNSDFDKTKERESGLISWLLGTPQKVMADASDNPSDYLADGDEIVFSQAIQDQADALENDPLAIYNFVLNEVEYLPYYGSKKGSAATLIERAGNDTDQASLLIAMLRYSEVPARYRHVDAKFDVETVNALLGVASATTSAQILSLRDVPYQLYTLNGEPYFFVIEHTYVEAYLPYGASRGANTEDGGESQWVPMDPSISGYYYDQEDNLLQGMRDEGFDIEDFYDDYLDGDYGTSTEPLDAFKTDVETYLASSTDLIYEDAIMYMSRDEQELDFIPGTLPFEISADLNTYDYIPSSLRHEIEFTVLDEQDNPTLNYTAYVSDVADKELLVTYGAATQNDQDIIDGFDTIYDVVPLSIVAVVPQIKVNGIVIATGTATTTMGQSHEYVLDFHQPDRNIGESIVTELQATFDKKVITGNTEAVALNTDRVIPPEILPAEDTETTSFVNSQVLYKNALSYLNRLQYTHGELTDIIGGDFGHVATKASVFNGIEVTKSMGEPYSFEWTGLRIDAASKVNYYHRLDDINTNREEFMAIFGLQSSQDESDLFEDNFGVESVSTVKGLKMVADGYFPGVTLVKITEANENDIDSLSIATSTKTIFHTAISNGRIIYTPSEAVTYEGWEGLFYITVNFEGGDGSYIIGEGLNGGYTVEEFPSGLQHMLKTLIPGVDANIISPTSNSTHKHGQWIYWTVDYETWVPLSDWRENTQIPANQFYPGSVTLRSGYGTSDSVTIKIARSDYSGISFQESTWVHESEDRFGDVVEQIKDLALEDDSFYWNDVATAIDALDDYEKGVLLENTISLVGSSLPLLGEASDAYAVFLKEDMFTQEELNGLDQTISGAALFIPFLGAKAIKISKPIMAAVQLGKKGESSLKTALNALYPGATLVAGGKGITNIPVGGKKLTRYVDITDTTNRILHESKVGRVSNTKFIREQIAKDKWLIQNSDTALGGVRWNFYESPITGKQGPTRSVKQQLEKAGITICFFASFTDTSPSCDAPPYFPY